MNLGTFFEKFDQFVEAPNAIAKMRELVLQLAVQGKLMEQDKDEGHADSLLKRIKSEKARLVKERMIRKQDTDPIGKDEELFSIPKSWVWTRLGEIGDWGSGSTPSRGNYDLYGGGITWLKSGELNDNQALADSEETVTELAIKTGSFRMNRPGDILIAMYGATIGKAAILAKPAVTNQAICGCTPFEGVSNLYLFNYLLAQRARFHSASEGGAQPNISKVKIVGFPFPLPPLAEQKRIVAKVDELMALCDRLETQQQERDTQHAALARISLARFADAPTPANLNLLFHPSYAIAPADLHKTILTLAVQGKLVPQDENDEPAETILAGTKSLFERMVGDREITMPKPLTPITDDDQPFDLPKGWSWCRLGQLLRISSGDGLTSKNMNDGPFPVYGGNGITGHHNAYNVARPTLVIGRVGFYCGSIHVTPDKAWVTDNAFITTFDENNMNLGFLIWLLKTTDLRKRDNATAQPVISGAKLYPIVLAIPPLAEQRRIVVKVDRLMALVDQLETQLAASRATATNLMEAVVAELTAQE